MSIEDKIVSIRKEFLTDTDSYSDNKINIDELKVKYLGRKGLLSQVFDLLKNSDSKDRPVLGKKLNLFKKEISDHLEKITSEVEIKNSSYEVDDLDFSLIQ